MNLVGGKDFSMDLKPKEGRTSLLESIASTDLKSTEILPLDITVTTIAKEGVSYL